MSYLHAIQILKEEQSALQRHRRIMSRMLDECGVGWANGATEALWLSDVNNALTVLEDLQERSKRAYSEASEKWGK